MTAPWVPTGSGVSRCTTPARSTPGALDYRDWLHGLFNRPLPKPCTPPRAYAQVVVIREDWLERLWATGYSRQPADAREVIELESDRIFGRVEVSA